MIERLLAAEGALARDELDAAERMYGQVADADPRNAIALVGLARVAARRDDPEGARGFAERALAIDPDEAAARRLLVELSEPRQLQEPVPVIESVPAPEPARPVQPAAPQNASVTAKAPRPAAPRRPLLDRLLGWLRRRR